MNIGDRIQRYRKGRGWTQKQLAERSGVPQAAISKIERGQVKPLFETIIRVAEAFGLGVDELAGIPASKRGAGSKPLNPSVLGLLQTNPSLAEALQNPSIVKLITELSHGYPLNAKNSDLQVLLEAALRVLNSR